MIDLNELCKVTLSNAELRNKNDGNIKIDTRSMLKHTATEVVEATEAYSKFQSAIYTEFALGDYVDHFASELADIICCVLIIACKENINIEKAVLDCIEKNRKRAEGIGDKL